MADISAAEVALIGAGGAFVGVVGKGVLDWLLAIGKVRADREARDEARRDKRIERRDDLQRQTMLDLQQAISELAQNTTEGDTHDRAARRNGERWGAVYWPAVIAKGRDTELARMRLIGSRVRDDQLRKAAAEFAALCVGIGNAETDEEADRLKEMAVELFHQTQDRAGQLIREMDDVS